MIIRMIIAALLSLVAYYLVMRYNMHMFQLNGYKNIEHTNWLKKNIRQQWILLWSMFLGIIRLTVNSIILDVIIYITLLTIIVVYNAMKHLNIKKKLVFTQRIKRIIITNVVIVIMILFLTEIIIGFEKLIGMFLVIVSTQFLMNIVSNIVNYPIEKAINRHYINDAMSKLKKVPELQIIGITGSYGKTSVKFYLQTLLQEKYSVLVTPESFNTPMGVVRTIREYLKPTHEIFICEMGARHIGDIKEICDIVHPNHGMITSIGPQHLETFYNMENIQSTKFELANALPVNGWLFLNGDNEYINNQATHYSNKVFYYSEIEGKGYYSKNIKVTQLGTEFTVVTPEGEEEHFKTRLIGAHNVINIVGAIAVAHKLGISLKDLRIPVRRIQPVEHRMQMREHGLVTIIDDAYNSNPIGSKAAVETLALFDGIRILITPGMVELGDQEEEYNYMFGTYAAESCDYVLLVGKKRTESIKSGVLSKGFDEEKCQVFHKLEEAVSYAYAIKGQGHKYILLENDLPDNY